MSRVKEMKVGQSFYMKGIAYTGTETVVKAKLVESDSGNYVVEQGGVRIQLDGYEKCWVNKP